MVYVVLAGVVLFALTLFLALRYARKSGQAGAERDVLAEGRELEVQAEARLAERRRGSALVARLRRKRRGSQAPPPASS